MVVRFCGLGSRFRFKVLHLSFRTPAQGLQDFALDFPLGRSSYAASIIGDSYRMVARDSRRLIGDSYQDRSDDRKNYLALGLGM